MSDAAPGPAPEIPTSPDAHRLDTLDQRLTRVEAETRALHETVRQLHAYLAAVAEYQQKAAAQAKAGSPAAGAAGQLLAARQATRPAEGSAPAASPASKAPDGAPASAPAPDPSAPPARPAPTGADSYGPTLSPDQQVVAARQREAAAAGQRAEAQLRAGELANAKVTTAPPSSKPPRPTVSFEDVLAKGLLGVGGVLLLIGAAVGAVLILPLLPEYARVLLGFAFAAVIGGAGFGLSFRALWPGRVVLMIGLSLAFFVSFSTGFIPQVMFLPAAWAVPVAVAMMFVFVGAIAACAEAWKSESVAAFGLMLGVVAALASAPTSQAAALVALVILAVAAGALMVMHEWVKLNTAALLFIAGATLAMWWIAPVPAEGGVVAAHLGALACYYLIFTAAFARWGRVAMAQERLAIEAPEQHATPRVHLEGATLAYSSVFAQVNSLVFGALAVWLLHFSKVYWDIVYLPLAAMAVLEAGRLVVPVLRRGTLLGFHTVTSLGLAATALVAYYDGLAESAVMAFMTLVVAMVASRSMMLGWLRPLTIVTTMMALPTFQFEGATTPMELAARLLPPVFLLLSVLPWEAIAVGKPRRYSWGFVELLEILSGNSRAIVASLMITFVLISWYGPTNPSTGGMVIIAKGVLLLLGVLVLSAWNWFGAMTLALCFGTFLLGMEVKGQPWFFVVAACWTLVAAMLWHEVARQSQSALARFCSLLGMIGMVGCLALLSTIMVAPVPAWNGLALSALALATAGVGLFASRMSEWPRLIEPAPYEEKQWSITGQRGVADEVWPYARVAWGVALVLAAVGWSQVVVSDSRQQLGSALIIAAVWAALWAMAVRSTKWPAAVRWPLALAAVFTICPALLVFGEGRALALAGIWVFASAAMIAGMAVRDKAAVAAGAMWQVALGPLVFLAMIGVSNPVAYESAVALLIGLAVMVVATAARWGMARCGLAKGEQTLVQAGVIAAGVMAALSALGSGVLLPGYLVTASWGLLAAGLLVAGFAARDAVVRYAAFAVFVLAIGRIVVFDMARMDTFTRFVAFFGLGFLMIAGGVAYWFLRPRTHTAPPEAK